jgi:DnaK suppressor protein
MHRIRYGKGKGMEKDWDEYTDEEKVQIKNSILSLLKEHRDFVASEQESGVVELDQSRMGRLARIDAIQNQQAVKKQVNRIKREIKALELAEIRINRAPDDFGYCKDCDALIPFQRLMARPFERRCVPCTQELESL